MNFEIIKTMNHPSLGGVAIAENNKDVKQYIIERGLNFFVFGKEHEFLEGVKLFDNLDPRFPYPEANLGGRTGLNKVAFPLPTKDILLDLMKQKD